MNPSVFRLVLCGGLFVAWLAYLGWQVLDRPTMNGRPLVVSRPQVLASEVDVVAVVNDKSGEAIVVEVLYPDDSPLQEGDVLQVSGIGDAAPRHGPSDETLPPLDWSGPGKYLLPLRAIPGKKNHFEVQPIPASPGFTPSILEPPQRIYPATRQALAQYRQIAKP